MRQSIRPQYCHYPLSATSHTTNLPIRAKKLTSFHCLLNRTLGLKELNYLPLSPESKSEQLRRQRVFFPGREPQSS